MSTAASTGTATFEESGEDGKKGPKIGQAVLGRMNYGLLEFSYSSYVSLW